MFLKSHQKLVKPLKVILKVENFTLGKFLACKAESDGHLIPVTHNLYRMSAPSCDDMNSWISSIQ